MTSGGETSVSLGKTYPARVLQSFAAGGHQNGKILRNKDGTYVSRLHIVPRSFGERVWFVKGRGPECMPRAQ